MRAYGVKSFQVHGPDWLQSAEFDVAAELPPSTTDDQVPGMWQNLLVERFHFKVHHEEKPTNVFDLVVAKGGPKLQLADAPEPDTSNVPGVMHVNMRRETTDELADYLAEMLQAPVRNKTGLRDMYRIRLGWTPDSSAAVDPNGPTLMQAVDDELGLHLSPTKGTSDFLIIDHIERVPSDN